MPAEHSPQVRKCGRPSTGPQQCTHAASAGQPLGSPNMGLWARAGCGAPMLPGMTSSGMARRTRTSGMPNMVASLAREPCGAATPLACAACSDWSVHSQAPDACGPWTDTRQRCQGAAPWQLPDVWVDAGGGRVTAGMCVRGTRVLLKAHGRLEQAVHDAGGDLLVMRKRHRGQEIHDTKERNYDGRQRLQLGEDVRRV